MKDATILVVDDDPGYRDLLEGVLGRRFSRVLSANCGEQALERISECTIDLMLLDMRMPGMGGLGVLQQLSAQGVEIPTLVLTAYAEVDDAVQAMKLGARDYLRKPIDLAELVELMEVHLGNPATQDVSSQPLPTGFVAESPAMRSLLLELAQIAQSDAPLLLLGESGTGKEELANLVHEWSPRKGHPMMAVNVTALPASLIESELFGHAKGSFTGADQRRDGLIRSADGGTLFLDEIGDMPIDAQPKVLRVLESGEVKRVGESQTTPVDFRLISATHRNLEESIEAGEFRLDLYYRLAVVTLEVPALRQRREDVLPLARLFLAKAGGEKKQLSPDVCALLESYRWPGNIRELRNVITRATILSPGDRILAEHLPPNLRSAGSPTEELMSLAAMERRAILSALENNDGNRTLAARELGISRRKLLYRLKEYETEE